MEILRYKGSNVAVVCYDMTPIEDALPATLKIVDELETEGFRIKQVMPSGASWNFILEKV